MINCNTMRLAVSLSALLLITGVSFGLMSMTSPLLMTISYLALILVLASGSILALIFLMALLPPVARRLAGCQH